MKTLDQLQQTARTITNLRPAYREILDFYKEVFRVQEESLKDIQLPPIMIEPGLLKIKQKNELPLIDPSEFLIDLKAAARTFADICGLAQALAPGLSANARFLEKALSRTAFDLEALFCALLNRHEKAVQDISRLLDVPAAELSLFGYLSMAPSIRACREQLEIYLAGMPELQKGYCPVCGNPPDLGFLDQDGGQHLHCSFCSHEWKSGRMGCVFCKNNSKDMQHYFFNEEEKEYRVRLCDHCHRFIKLVDLRQMDREFFPDLERIATLHLDMQAREKGYINEGAAGNEAYH
nr:formate dehydrogenase accessory protein FdhE [Desulfobacula sp.]